MKKNLFVLTAWLIGGLLITSCSNQGANSADTLSATGTISAESVKVAPEIGGKVSKVFYAEGDTVMAGEPLFSLDSEYLQAQLDQAKAAQKTAKAALAISEVQAATATTQLEMAKQNSRLQFSDALDSEQRRAQPGVFELPVWYFSREEEIRTAELIVEKAELDLTAKKESLEDTLSDIVNREFITLEVELATAQNDYRVADATLDAVSRASENKELKDAAQDRFDLKEKTLEDVQVRYEKALETKEAEDVLKARAELGVAQTTYDEALNYLLSLYIGDEALQVRAAELNKEMADKQVEQAQAAFQQAQTAVATIEIQLSKTTVLAPISGKILTRNVEAGELVGAGGVVMTVGNFDTVSLKVYVPEDRYGRVSLGQDVKVRVDSFPEMVYMGKVISIADQAEFTPSNVQTVEGRKSTVFAVEISIRNDEHHLKPGMPADVEFLF